MEIVAQMPGSTWRVCVSGRRLEQLKRMEERGVVFFRLNDDGTEEQITAEEAAAKVGVHTFQIPFAQDITALKERLEDVSEFLQSLTELLTKILSVVPGLSDLAGGLQDALQTMQEREKDREAKQHDTETGNNGV